MTQGFVGADPQQLVALAGRLDREAEALDQIRSAISSILGRAYWEGRDAEDYRSQWRSRHTAAILAACTTLRDMAGALRANAAQQDQASAVTGVTGGGTVTGTIGGRGPLETLDRLVAGGQALLWLGDDPLGNLHLDRALTGTLQDFKHLAEHAGPFKVGPLDALSLGVHAGQLMDEIRNGDVQFSTVFNVAWDTASLHPVGGLLTGAWDTGFLIGTGAGEFLDEKFHMNDAIFQSIIHDKYGGSLDPTEAADMNARYSAWNWPVNVTADLLVSEAHFIGDGFKSLWNKVF